MECGRCHRHPRKHYAMLIVPVDVVADYQTKERVHLGEGDCLCSRCWHSLLVIYGGSSEGMEVRPRPQMHPPFVRADGEPVLRF